MILVDTSIWIDQLRSSDDRLDMSLAADDVLIHSYVIGELALGSLDRRLAFLAELSRLPQVAVASHEAVMTLVENRRLFGFGIGYVDAHLLASARLAEEISLWTRDRRLDRAARMIGVAFDL